MVSNLYMRPLIVVLSSALLICPIAFGQKKVDGQVRISCPPVRTKLIKLVRPKYPEEAKQTGVQGTVSLRCIIGIDGSVEKIEVISGHQALVPAATKAVSQWMYKPLVLNGKPVQMDTTVDVIFRLPKAQQSK